VRWSSLFLLNLVVSFFGCPLFNDSRRHGMLTVISSLVAWLCSLRRG
jgi:capsule polysaccharide modification protein KpsS